MSRKDTERWLNSAAVYVRMSTEHQQYSTSNQMDVIRENAKKRGLGIVKEYSDEGKSGLNIQGRDSLSQMIRDVEERRGQLGARGGGVEHACPRRESLHEFAERHSRASG